MRFRVTETGDEIVATRAAGGDHHHQQREGAARRLPAPLRLPLHRLPRPGADEAHRARAPPRARRRRSSTRRSRASTSCATSPRLRKRPSTSELIDWIAVLQARRRRRGASSTRSCPSSARCSRRSRTWRRFADQLAGGKKLAGLSHVRRVPLRAAARARSRWARRRRSRSPRALAAGLHDSSLDGFYHVARALLVHSEAHLDDVRPGLRRPLPRRRTSRPSASRQELLDWLEEAAVKHARALAPRSARRSRRSTSTRCCGRSSRSGCAEQKERHDGGNRWIGTGGTSPFGRGRRAPAGHPGRARRRRRRGSAMKTADARKYRRYRSDLVLDVRADRGRAAQAARLRPRGRRATSSTSTAPSTRPRRTPASSRSSPRPPRRPNTRVHPADGRGRLDGPVRPARVPALQRREARHPLGASCAPTTSTTASTAGSTGPRASRTRCPSPSCSPSAARTTSWCSSATR